MICNKNKYVTDSCRNSLTVVQSSRITWTQKKAREDNTWMTSSVTQW